MDIKEILLLLFITFLIIKIYTSGVAIKSMSNERLAEELDKPIIKTFKKRKVY